MATMRWFSGDKMCHKKVQKDCNQQPVMKPWWLCLLKFLLRTQNNVNEYNDITCGIYANGKKL